MKKFEYMCDMGSLKIMFEGGCCFFGNNIGDGIYKVYIFKDEEEFDKHTEKKRVEFIEHFTVFEKAWLMYSDCDVEQKQYQFDKGRYFVSLDMNGTFYIYKNDWDIHA